MKAAEAFLKGVRKGGELRLAETDNMHLIWPNYFKNGLQQSVMPLFDGYIFETLMERDFLAPSRTLKPALAESITIRADLKTVIFNLRPNVHFSDGSLFTAQDVLDSYVFQRDVSNGPAWEVFYGQYVGHPELKVIDDQHVEIKFVDLPPEKMRVALINVLGMPMVKKNSRPDEFEIPNAYIGTGPYVVTAAKHSRVVLTRRADYWASDRPFYNFDTIILDHFATLAVAREALTAHAINFWSENDYWATKALKDTSRSSFFTSTDVNKLGFVNERYRSRVLAINASNPYLASLNMRKAIALAYDSDVAMYGFFGNRFTNVPTLGFASEFRPTGSAGPEVRKLMKDPNLAAEANKPFEVSGLMETTLFKTKRERLKRAMELLREAGFVPRAGHLEKDGKPMRFVLLLPPDDFALRPMLLLQSYLRLLGIDLELRMAPDAAVFEKSFRGGQFDLIPSNVAWPRRYKEIPAESLSYSFGSVNAVDNYPKGSGNNPFNLKSPAIDKILADLQSLEPEADAYRIRNEALIRLITAAVPFVPIGESDSTTYFHDRKICVADYTGIEMLSAYVCH